MAPGGRGSLRPYQPSKFQPFLIVCLFVTVVVVGYNFWNLMRRNSVLLVEIGKLQGSLRRLESDRKDCKVQLASVEEERRRHEASDKEKEIALEDTRRVVEDLRSEADILKLNISNQLTQIKRSELQEDAFRRECDQKVEAARTELQDSCVRGKEKIQEEMNSQLGETKNQLAEMKKQLKLQYQETEHLDQMLQQQKQQPGDGKDKAQSGNIPERQPPALRREVQASQNDQTSRLADQLETGRSLSNREHPGVQRNLTYHSKRSRSRNSQIGRSSLHRRQPEPVIDDGVLRLTQAAVRRIIPEERSSNISEQVPANGYQQTLIKENKNEGIQQKEPRRETAGEQAKPVHDTVPESVNFHSDQNAGAADEKSLQFQRLAQESRKAAALGHKSGGQEQSQGQDKEQVQGQDKEQVQGQDKEQVQGQDKEQVQGQYKEQVQGQDNVNAEGKEVVHDGQIRAADQMPSVIDSTKLKQNQQGSLKDVEIPERNLVEDGKENLPEDAQNRQLHRRDKEIPSQN